MVENKAFLGRGWAFPPTFIKADGNVELVAAEEDIRQSLHILLSTSLRERVMRPEYGCNLRDYIFEAMNSSLIDFIKDLVETAILFYESRIKLLNVTITESDSFTAIEGRLEIGVEYMIKGTNSRYNFVFPFYLEEGASQ